MEERGIGIMTHQLPLKSWTMQGLCVNEERPVWCHREELLEHLFFGSTNGQLLLKESSNLYECKIMVIFICEKTDPK